MFDCLYESIVLIVFCVVLSSMMAVLCRALAKNCDATVNDKSGGSAKDWKKGRPVRVVRSAKGKKHSKYAPDEGCRYDGLYKIVKYWPEKGAAGFKVWRYLLRRDDPVRRVFYRVCLCVLCVVLKRAYL